MDNWGKGKPRRRTSEANWRQPLKWNRDAANATGLPCVRCGVYHPATSFGPDGCQRYTLPRPRVFCASLADWLDDEVPIEWLADLLKLIHDTPNLDWLLLTKRPENWLSRTTAIWKSEALDSPLRKMLLTWQAGEAPPNIWIGTSIEDQKRADERIPHLLKIPAKVRFLSVEPLLGPVNLCAKLPIYEHIGKPCCTESVGLHRTQKPTEIHWIICGGESGHKARPCNVEWIRSIVRQCKAAGVSCFVKQLGSFPVTSDFDLTKWPLKTELQFGCPDEALVKLKDRKGGDLSEWPKDLRIREFPV